MYRLENRQEKQIKSYISTSLSNSPFISMVLCDCKPYQLDHSIMIKIKIYMSLKHMV